MAYTLKVKSKVNGETFYEGDVDTMEEACARARWLESSLLGVKVSIIEIRRKKHEATDKGRNTV